MTTPPFTPAPLRAALAAVPRSPSPLPLSAALQWLLQQRRGQKNTQPPTAK